MLYRETLRMNEEFSTGGDHFVKRRRSNRQILPKFQRFEKVAALLTLESGPVKIRK